MRISVGVIFSLILLWSGIFTFIFVVFRMVLLKDTRKHVIDLFDIEDQVILLQNNNTQGMVETFASIHQQDQQSSHATSSQSHSKYAYVTLLHGIDDTFSYRGYLYNCFIVKKALAELGSKADFVVLVGFTYGVNPKNDKISHDLALLAKFGIKLHYLPRLDEINTAHSAGINDPATQMDPATIATTPVTSIKSAGNGHKHKKVLFLEMALLKITPWSFSQYEKIQFFDGDVLPHRNMDCFFKLGVNTFNTGNASPLNSGWFLALPNQTDYTALHAKAVKR